MSQIAKAGWLERQSSILKRWKKSWFTLTVDGYLRYFEDDKKSVAEDTLFLPDHVTQIKIGSYPNAPEGHSPKHTIEIICHNKENWIVCADSLDDALAWQFALEQARVLRQPHRQLTAAPPQYILEAIYNNPNCGYPIYYYGPYTGNYPSRIIQTPQGPVTIVYVDRDAYDPGYSSCLFGALAGATLASTLIWPFWWPIWWC